MCLSPFTLAGSVKKSTFAFPLDQGDTKNDDTFAEALAKSTGAEVFIMDAFGVSHRNQASVTVCSLAPGQLCNIASPT